MPVPTRPVPGSFSAAQAPDACTEAAAGKTVSARRGSNQVKDERKEQTHA
jgi:hypothetical protein